MKLKHLRLLATVFVIVLPTTLYGQQSSTVGEILDRRGAKISGDEVRNLLSGATITGLQFNFPGTFQMTYKESGYAEGFGSSRDVYVSGTWWVNEDGQLCTNLRNNRGTRLGGCSYYFKLNDSYFNAQSDERSSRALERQVKR